MKVYLRCSIVDLGYNVDSVYYSKEKAGAITKSKLYVMNPNTKLLEFYKESEDTYDTDDSNIFVIEKEVT